MPTNISEKKNLTILSGLAGAGKTVAIHALEDLGFYCIDNLPGALLSSFTESIKNDTLKATNIALALDSRDVEIAKVFKKYYPILSRTCEVKIIFLVASEEVILKRFRETRRQHPLNTQLPLLSLKKAIKLDRKTLEPIEKIANQVIDTSHMQPQYLKRYVHNYLANRNDDHLLLNIISFGFKYGIPTDLDTIFDVRCFKNPHYEKHLRHFTGLNDDVKEYVFSDENVAIFINKVVDFVTFLYPLYLQEGKHYFSIGIGCTGGKHRSVAIVEELAKLFKKTMPFVIAEHRHAEKE